MAAFTYDAQQHLDCYVKQVRAALRNHRTVDATDVERDVMSHIDAELAAHPHPIDAATLLPVLTRLGAPGGWVPDEDLSVWRRALNRLRAGPGDYRLAAVTAGLFLLGVLLFFNGPFLWPLEPLLVLASVATARACLAQLAEHDEPVSNRGWLVYPPLIAAYVPGLILLILFPAAIAVLAEGDAAAVGSRAVGTGLHKLAGRSPGVALAAAAVLGVWWVLLGLVSTWTRLVHALFYPFAARFSRRHAMWIAAGGLLTATTAVALLLVRR